ncbi:chaperonin 10-like protein [Suillus subalutaceus]|uniref:chaperonin 10-like protein n=1 Tax=Suillus subalutaceus TaxID=48586 RepID=UPI001B87B5B4|nr:chaperonin 10-like protein [Suillus subalutaceus]KAG1870731.1 chaperonin 10-like protein [Suillus subalutaceus]
MPQQQKALIFPQKRANLKVGSRSIPSPGTRQLLVKIHSAVLNPVDYMIRNTGVFLTHYPVILGVDIAGIVEELVGEGVENFCKGDKVLAHGSFPIIDQGAFQQYALTVATLTAKIPSKQFFDSAATVPLGLDTAVVGLYGSLVILNGSSSVGSYSKRAIQLARFSGFDPVVTTAFPSNEDLVRDYGATHLFDWHLSGNQLVAAIGKVIDSPFRIVFDAISLPETQSVEWRLLAQNGIIVLTLPASVKEDEGKGHKTIYINGDPHLPYTHELFCNSWAMVETWLLEGIIQPNNHEILPNGLEGVIGGLERVGMGQVSGVKLVAHPQETQ